jgi:phytoene synthase
VTVAIPSYDASRGSYATADASLQAHGRTFYWARSLLGTQHARRATRLYWFCRNLDDIVDATGTSPAAQNALEAARRALDGWDTQNPVLRDARELFKECRIDPAIPLELIYGLESDLGVVRMRDVPELLRYCYRVAGTVGIMMSGLLDVTKPAAFFHAVDLGIAMQLTNICRDVAEDARADRRYLPADLVGDIQPSCLIAPTGTLRATAQGAVRTLLDLADRYYVSGERGLAYLPAGARAGILVAARIYRQIGMTLRRQDFDCWSGRAVVGRVGKLTVTIRALPRIAQLLAEGSAPPHDQNMHRALLGLPYVAL